MDANKIFDGGFAGRHLIMDVELTDESKEIVNSVSSMSEYLNEVTNITGMTLVFPVIAAKFPFSSEVHKVVKNLEAEGIQSKYLDEYKKFLHTRDTDGSGVSAISVWLESHCSLHSWPENNYISIDLFTCKYFDVEPVIEFTNKYMKAKINHVTVLDRQLFSTPVIKSYTLDSTTER